MSTKKNCLIHGTKKHPYCVDCLKYDYAETAGPETHDAKWESLFIKPLAKFMMDKGIRHLAIVVDGGKATYGIYPSDVDPLDSSQTEKIGQHGLGAAGAQSQGAYLGAAIQHFSHDQVAAWMLRYNIGGSISEGRCAMEDAATLHLTDKPF